MVASDIALLNTGDGQPAKAFIVGVSEDSKYYRLYILNSVAGKGILDLHIESIEQAIVSGHLKLYNAESSGGELVGTNGSLNRYCSIVPTVEQLPSASNVVIIAELVDSKDNLVGYKFVSTNGEVFDNSEKNLISICKQLTQKYSAIQKDYYPIANGKIVIQKNGDTHISAIKGNYNRVTVSPKKKSTNTSCVNQTTSYTSADYKDIFKAIKIATEISSERLNIKVCNSVKSDAVYVWLQNDQESLNTITEGLSYLSTVQEKAKNIVRGRGKFAFKDTNGGVVDLTDRYKSWKSARPSFSIEPLVNSMR